MNNNEHEPETDEQTRPIEAVWKEILVSRGVPETEADTITTLVQSHPKAAFGTPTKEELETIVTTHVDSLDLSEFGIDDDTDVKDELKSVLSKRLDADQRGPVTSTTSREPTPWDTSIDTAGSTQETAKDQTTRTISKPFTPQSPGENDIVLEDQGIAGAGGMINDTAFLDGDSLSLTAEETPTETPETASASGGASMGTPNPDVREGREAEEPDPEAESAGGATAATGDDDDAPQQASASPQQEPSGERNEESVARMVARGQFERDREVLNSVLDVPLDLVDQVMVVFASKAIASYEDLLRQELFEGSSPAEREILFEKLIQDRVESQIVKRMNDEDE